MLYVIAGVLVLLATLASCYATIGTPPGPTCSQDPNNPACVQPLTDKTKPKEPR